MDTDVLVVGGGASGLACARELRRRGTDVLVVEARDRIGGRIHTVHGFADEPIELGAMLVHGERAAVVEIAREAGIALGHPRWSREGRAMRVEAGRMRPVTAGGWGWHLEGEVAALRGPDRPIREVLRDAGWDVETRATAEEIFAQIWCADPRLLSAEGVTRVEDAWTSGYDNLVVSDGYDAVPRFLARGVPVELEAPVERIAWRRGRVDAHIGGGRRVTARAAVTTVPPSVVAAGRLGFDPALPRAQAAAAGAIPVGAVIRVAARLREPAPEGGWVTGLGADGGMWRVTPGETLMTVWIGGPAAAAASGADAVDLVLRAAPAFPWLDRDAIEDVRCADWLADPWSLGGYSYPRAGALDAPAAWAAPVDRTLFFCGEATCGDVHPATVHGAIESGLRAASEVTAALG